MNFSKDKKYQKNKLRHSQHMYHLFFKSDRKCITEAEIKDTQVSTNHNLTQSHCNLLDNLHETLFHICSPNINSQ